MGTTELQKDERLQWLRFVITQELPLPEIQDWKRLFVFIQKQAIAGICSPTRFDEVRPDTEVLFEWIGLTEQLKTQNVMLNKRATEVVAKLKEAGFRCCILKGQGNATMYPVPELRTPGDIDVWVDADKERMDNYVRSNFPEAKECFKHIKFPVFEDVEVDVHQTPLKFCHPKYNRRLQRWIAGMKDGQMTNRVRLTGTDSDIAIPTADFNAVYQLGHILIHLADEGIGLRHMVDYYYVLKALRYKSINQQEAVRKALSELGMMRVAAAVMWVEHEVLGLPGEYLLTSPDERQGRLILEDILEGGNFGKYAERHADVGSGRIKKRMAKLRRLIKLSRIAPGEFFYHGFRRAGNLILKLLG